MSSLAQRRVFVPRSFGPRLTWARRERGMTQYDLAVQIGLGDASVVCTWERGKHLPGADNLAHIALALDVTTDWLLFGDERT